MVIGVLIFAMLSACGPGERQTDLSSTNTAVEASSPRIVRVEASDNTVSGLGTDITYELRFNSKKPATAEDVDEIVRAIWENSPFEPNIINIVAFADDSQEIAVDLRTGAAGLEPDLYSTGFQSGGISVTRMWKRYGKWEKP